MKRRRSLVDCKIKKGKRVAELCPRLFSTIENVPDAMVEIFLRLSIKELIMCKSVCKVWYHLIRMPEFAKQHFARAQPCAVVKRYEPAQICRMIYLIEPHIVTNSICECVSCKHKVSLKLDTAMKIPLRNIELLSAINGDSITKRGEKRCTQASPTPHEFRIVNSCNGFLCLSDPQSNNPMTVCNPVTGEYLNIPGTEIDDKIMVNIVCGFGYSPKLNKYKVIRMFEQGESQVVHSLFDGSECHSRTIVETYTFGKGSWERIGHIPVSMYSNQSLSSHRPIYSHHFPIYCNGSVNWLLRQPQRFCFEICSFDLDDDCFKSIELPLAYDVLNSFDTCLGELGGCLCLFYFSPHEFTIWVMKKHGSPSSWTKMITVARSYYSRRMPWPSFLPISYTEEAGLIMFTDSHSGFVHLNSDFTYNVKYWKIRGVQSQYEAYLYVPTLVSLKDALTDEEILNVNTKDIKLSRDSKRIFLEEDIWDLETRTEHSDCDSSNE